MTVGDKVWVVLTCEDDCDMVALPREPQEGTIQFVEQDECLVWVDNDMLHVEMKNIFTQSGFAWLDWKRKMREKIDRLQRIHDRGSLA